ncbi:cytochrome P450 [Rhodococcus opacus]|nr:cytochrome P450 [Rhodococcus opacus]
MSTVTESTAILPPYSHESEWPTDLPAFKVIDEDGSQGVPYAHYAWMREHAPVLRAQTPGEDVWFVSRYQDVRKALRAPKVFSSQVTEPVPLTFLTLFDAPNHTRLRQVVARAFTPKSVAKVEDRVRENAARYLDEMIAAGGGEVTTSYSVPLSMSTISAILDVPAADIDKMKFWSDEMFTYFARVARTAPGSGDDEKNTMEFFDYLQENLERLYREDSEAVGGHIARMWKEGLLSDKEAHELCGFMFVAGHDTTTLLMTMAFQEFTHHPDLLGRIRTNPDEAEKFVEELARFRGSVHRTVRRTNDDVEIAGTVIPKGAVVRLLIASANRDETKFPDAHEFDMDRDTEGHFGFGCGIHSCIGSPLVRLELRVTSKLLSARLESIAIDPDHAIEYMHGNNLTVGPERMRVLLRAVGA